MTEERDDSDLEMLTVEQASKLLQLSPEQIRALLRSGQLPGVRFRIADRRAKWLLPVKKLQKAIEDFTTGSPEKKK